VPPLHPTHASPLHVAASLHLKKKLAAVAVVKEKWYDKAKQRWDESAGGEIDGMLKDDGPQQLRSAMIILCAVAGIVICGGACGIVVCWSQRERGWSSAAKRKNRANGDYSHLDDGKNPYQGGGAEWLKMDPV
jgi:hypothetical protein